MQNLRLDVRVGPRHVCEDFVPEGHGVIQGVRLRGRRHLLLPVARPGQLEGAAHHALGTPPGDHRDLEAQLLGCTRMQAPPDVGILALAVFTDDHKIHLSFVPDGGNDTGPELEGTDVYVQPEAAAHPVHEPLGSDPLWQAGIPMGAKEHRVESLQGLDPLLRHGGAVLEMVLRPPGELCTLIGSVPQGLGLPKDLEAFPDDLRATLVAGDNCDAKSHQRDLLWEIRVSGVVTGQVVENWPSGVFRVAGVTSPLGRTGEA